ncbi:hypothetical protein [Mammaliicoccus sciuri]|uniref:hypothetical protein n=1 Tax=Mammaliicoccus sciuri TaxID=1296 RepID=UPI001FB1E388|nr:hypothetical protein [Mammaliicoccus sciuri]MCJ0958748.1 hypothetical protein [Mammaliicoccus sciuri]
MFDIFGKEKFSRNKLVPIFFVGFPFVIGGIISWFFEYLIEFEKVMAFVTVSSWFFSFFSILLIFMVWEKFRESIVRKDFRDKRYLNRDAISELEPAVSDVILVIKGDKDIDKLSDSCGTIKYIYRKLTKQKQDTELYSVKPEMRELFNVINKYKLESIGREQRYEEWKGISEDKKQEILGKADELSRELKRLLEDI